MAWFEAANKLAHLLDSFRVFPRIFISIYILTYYQSIAWFMSLEEPSVHQFGLVSVITGVGAGWFAAYVATKRDGIITGDGGKPK